MSKNNFVIQTKDLTKSYGKPGEKKDVVKKVNLAVPEGCVYGFLGPNGAGKSTTMKMLLGLIKPTNGEISILGTPFISQGKAALPSSGRQALLLNRPPTMDIYQAGRIWKSSAP